MRAALFFSLLVGCSAVDPPVGEQHALTGASANTTDTSVVLLKIRSATTSELCTASVVSPHVAITAAHCVKPSLVGAGATISVFVGDDVRGAGQSYAVKESHAHPDFMFDTMTTKADIGVVVTEQAMAVAALPMSHGVPSAGQSLRLVGYGVTAHADDPQVTAGIRRESSAKVQSVDAELIKAGDATHQGCDGDSGSPAFFTEGGVERIAGVMSFSDTNCTIVTGYTRLDKYADAFVQPYIDEHDPPGVADLGSTETDGATSTTTEEGGCSALVGTPRVAPLSFVLVALALVLSRRRRA